MPPTEFDYEKDIYIDESALDVELLGQALLMIRYARKAAEARVEMDKAKDGVEVARAKLDKNIRIDPEQFEVVKITEGAVAAAILLQPQYKEANEAFLEARYEYDMARYAVQAIDQRKAALENLVRLHGQQYFAGPSIPRDLSREAQERAKQKRVDSKVTMTRGKRK